MAGRDYLREYLIGLGFEIKDEQYKKFHAAIGSAANKTAELGAAAISTSLAIGYMVEKAARQYEELYYVSQRTGQPVASLKAYEFAARQVGVSQDAARASTEAFFATLRTSPGSSGILQALGLGSGANPVQLVETLKKRFGEGGYFVAARFASQFGLDEQTLRQYWTNLDRLKAAEEDRLKRSKEGSLATKQTGESFMELNRALNELDDNFSIFRGNIAISFLEPTKKVVVAINEVIEAFNRLNKDTGGAAGTAVSIGGSVLAGLLFKRLAGSVLRRLGIIGGGAAAGGAAGAAGTVAAEGAAGAGEVAAGTAAAGGTAAATAMRLLGPVGVLLGSTQPAGEGSDNPERFRETEEAIRRQSGGSGTAGIIDFFVKKGWSREAAAGIAANLFKESKFKAGAVGDGGQAYGAAQWHPDRQAAFRQWSGKDIRESKLEEQLAFVHYELTQGGEQFAGRKLRQSQSAEEAGSTVSRYYERPGNAEGEAAARGQLARNMFDSTLTPPGGGNVTINHKTDINVAAGPTAQATAQAVAGEQEGVYSRAVRDNVPRTR